MAPVQPTPESGTRRRQAGPLAGLAEQAARRPWRGILLGLVLLILGAAAAAGTMDRLLLSRFESPGTESATVEQRLGEEFGTGKHHFLLLVTARSGDVDDPAVVAAAQRLEAELAERPEILETASYWSRGESPAMRSRDGSQAIVTARLAGTVTEARTALAGISADFSREDELISVQPGGGDEIFRQAAAQARADFLLAEAIVFPLVFLLLLLLFRRLAVAALTLGMGLFSVVTTLALLRAVTYLTDVSTFAANLVLVMGVGLGVDYSLFVISRFREELAAGAEPGPAVRVAVQRAGRTVAFSGLTVAVSLSCLLLFPFPFLQSFAYAGIGTVLTSVFAALVILPAALAKAGRRVLPRRGLEPERGWWHATALRMMRRPLLFGLPALALVLLLAAPALGLNVGLPDARVLPQGTSSRDVQDRIEQGFDQEQMDAVFVLVELPEGEGRAAELSEYATRLSRIPGVAQVDALTGRFADGQRLAGPEPGAERYAGPHAAWLSVVPEAFALADAERLLDEIARTPAPAPAAVGGYPADLHDFRTALLGAVPLVFGLILAATFVLLLLMTGSLLLAFKAIVLNVLSIAVMFGVMVWIFQEGHLSGPLGFTANGTLEATFPILMFCIAFGLSMDYEVFLLSRIKEEHDRGAATAEAVAAGLQRSGPLVTAAAGILAASFAVYAVSEVLYLKMLAIGMAAVIIVDATLIRAVLVPVFMRIAGEANWWAPRPLARAHGRFGLSE
ncbi:MAG: MMPL family transporter [Pseudoclavibacter sp.]|nr:MMPL family transporter [Pseudoclavibacter sp.]